MASTPIKFVLQGAPTKDKETNPVTQFQDFGIFEGKHAPLMKEIHMSDVMLDAQLFTQKLNDLDTTQIATITFKNVYYTNEFEDVYLPALTSFDFHSKFSTKEPFSSTSIFFFQKSKHEKFEHGAICSLGVNVSVVREYEKCFVVDEKQKSLYLRTSLKDIGDVLRHAVMTTRLEKLSIHATAHEEETLDLNVIPPHLKSLKLYVNEIPWSKVQEFLSKWVKLEKFIYSTHVFEKVQLVNLPPNLKKVTLSRCELEMSTEHMNSDLDSLCLMSSSISPENGIGSLLKTKKLLIMYAYPKFLSYATLDELLGSEGLDWVFIDAGTLHPKMPVERSDTGIALASIHKGNVRIPVMDHNICSHKVDGIIFWKDTNHEWNARNLFPEERQFLICEYAGVPLASNYPYSSLDLDDDVLGNPSVHVIIPTNRPEYWASEVLPPPLCRPTEIPYPLAIKHLWIQEARVYNEHLDALPLLDALQFITLKQVTTSIRKERSNSDVVSWHPKFVPREFDGFGLDGLPQSVQGITTFGTLLGSTLDKGQQMRTLDFLTIVESSAPSQVLRRLNVKQVVIDGGLSAECLECILSMTAVEVILVSAFERKNSNAKMDEFLRGASLSGWETAFVLFKNVADGTWHGTNLNVGTKIKYVQMAASFQWLHDDICANISATADMQFSNAGEYLHSEESMEGTADFLFPVGVERSLKQRDKKEMQERKQKLEIFKENQRWLTEGKYDLENESFERMGDYKTKVLESVDDMLFDAVFQRLAAVKILKLQRLILSRDGFGGMFEKLNPSLLTVLELRDVEVNDYFPVIRMENLKKFHLSVSHRTEQFGMEFLKSAENFAKGVLFWTSVEKQSVDNIWFMGTNISFSVGSTKYLEVDHGRKKLHLSKRTFLRKILNPEIEIRELVINSVSDVDFSRLNKSCLEVLSLQDVGCYDWEDAEEFLHGMSSLVEFYFYRKQFGSKMVVNLDGIPETVKYLALSEVQIPPNAPAKPLELENLLLLNCTLPPDLSAQFEEYFNARRVVLGTPPGSSCFETKRPKIRPNHDLLKAVVETKKTEWILVTDFEREWPSINREEIEAFLTKAMVPQPIASSHQRRISYEYPNALHLHKDENSTWRRFEPSVRYTSFLRQESIFEDLSLGRMADEKVFQNKLLYFAGFGADVRHLRSIEMHDVIVDSELFRKELRRLGTTGIERVSFHSVTFLGPPLQFSEIPFPNLKTFEATVDGREVTSWDTFKKTLFFRKHPHNTYKLKDLWKLGVEIVVKWSDGGEFLEVNPTTKKLRIPFQESQELLMQADGVRSLSFDSYTAVPFRIPHSLETVELACPLEWAALETLIAGNANLKELAFEPKWRNNGDRVAHLSKLPPNLTRLTLKNVELSLDPAFEKLKLKTVILQQCVFPYQDFLMRMHDVFDVEEMYFPGQWYNRKDVTPPELVYHFLKATNSRLLVWEGYSVDRPKPSSRLTEEMLSELNSVLHAASFKYKESMDATYETVTLAIRKDSETSTWTKITDSNPEFHFQ